MARGNKPKYRAFMSRTVGEGDQAKSIYTEIGAAWEVRDGGISVQLHALPIDGKLVLFLPKEDG
jgi:hypothetical protein